MSSNFKTTKIYIHGPTQVGPYYIQKYIGPAKLVVDPHMGNWTSNFPINLRFPVETYISNIIKTNNLTDSLPLSHLDVERLLVNKNVEIIKE